jgi:hypothetical protein
MKMNVRVGDDGSSDVWVFLTKQEVAGIARASRSRLEDEAGHRGPGYHLHVEDRVGADDRCARPRVVLDCASVPDGPLDREY